MKLPDLRKALRAPSPSAFDFQASVRESRERTKILERCACGHLAEEHAGVDERESLRGTKPALPIGYCYHCSCTRHNPEAKYSTTIPWPTATKETEAFSAREAEERRRFGDEVMSFSRDFRHGAMPFPTLVDAARFANEEGIKKLLGSHAFWVPPSKEHEPSEGDLVQLKGFFGDAGIALIFYVWDGRRDVSGNPITMDVFAKHLYVVEYVACPHERGDRSGSHATFRRGLMCKMCGNLGRVISSKSAKLLPRLKT